jgi:hypothetical protein
MPDDKINQIQREGLAIMWLTSVHRNLNSELREANEHLEERLKLVEQLIEKHRELQDFL